MSTGSVRAFFSWADRCEQGLRHGLFFLTLIVVLSYLLSGFPFAPLFEVTVNLRSGFRIAFGLVFLASLVRTRNALPLLYGHETVQQAQNDRLLLATYYLQFVIVAVFTLGFLTDIAALALLGVRTVFIERIRRFGLENTFYQMVIVHLPFLGLGAAYSVDSVIGLEPLIASPVMFNSLSVLIGVVTVSGAYHKLGSEMWLREQLIRGAPVGTRRGDFEKAVYVVSLRDGASHRDDRIFYRCREKVGR